MKTKISRLLGVGLTLVLLSSLLGFAVPVSASAQSFGAETLPSIVNSVLTPGEHISDLAVNGATAYAATGSVKKLYKTTDTGVSWKELSKAKATTSFPDDSVNLVAVAPDNPSVLAMATTNSTSVQRVFYSTDGGSSWTGLGEPATGITIRDIDISKDAAGYRYIAVGGDSGGTTPLVVTLKLAAGETWTNRVNATTGNFTASQTRVNAVQWSPTFDSDKILTVVSSTTTTATFQIMWYESPYYWNQRVTGYGDYGTGVPLTGIAAAIDLASIALAPDYLGNADETRIAFVGIKEGSSGGVYRLIDNNQDKTVTKWTGAATGPVRSVAYDGTRLMAGLDADHVVLVTDDPLATTPKFARENDMKQPGGAGGTIVAFAGTNVVAGTSGAESAFAVSTDNGYSFNDISLIDTAMNNIRDVTPAQDGTVVYVSSNNTANGVTSIWAKDSTGWKRVFTVADVNSSYLVRVSPEDAKVVYVVEAGGTAVYFSSDAGKVSWKSRPCYKLTDIKDFEVASNLVAYAIDSDQSSKTTNGGSSWGTAKALGITANMVTLAPNGDVIVGGTDGFVAWSKDGGSTWEKSEKTVGDSVGTVNVQVVADTDYATNGYIYASTDYSGAEGIYRSKTVPAEGFSSTYGKLVTSLTTLNEKVSGLAVYGSALYAIYYTTGTPTTDNNSYLIRSLNPAASVPKYSPATITKAYSQYELFSVAPRAVKVSTGAQLWAVTVKTETTSKVDAVYSYQDVIATTAPTLKAPATATKVPLNTTDGTAYDVTFSIERPSSKAKACELQIATDQDFTGIIWKKSTIDVWADEAIATVTVGPNGVAGDSSEKANYLPGLTYYFRARVAVDGPLYSPFTETRNFTVAAIPPAPKPIEVVIPPAQPAPIIQPIVKVELPAPIKIEIPAAPPAPAPITPGWIYAIIAIGAVLVIAVIVLIVRTRRVA